VQVEVLGKSPSWQDGDGACSGYLVREGEFSLLLDCGSGVFAKLRRVIDYAALDAILISHLHPDHFLDLVPFSFALNYSPRRREARRPALHAPPGGRATFERLAGCWDDPTQLERAFAVTEYIPSDELTIGPFVVRFCEVPHFTRSFACELRTAGQRVTFGADSSPNRQLIDFADGTDLLMLEATLERPEPEGTRGHMTAFEAGETARAAHAHRLVVTHFSDELDADWVRAEAVRGYGADVALATEGAQYALP
jgi:ribonuclease BN (tRNA processing enzyme)